jgi:hypothetical protein
VLRLYQQTGDRYQNANTLRYLGDTHYAAGDPAQARTVWELALVVLDELGHPLADLIRGKLRQFDAVARPVGTRLPEQPRFVTGVAR